MSSVDPTGGVSIGNMVPGLVSGLDTESMVEKMLSGTQSKLDKQYAKKQQIEWKQEIYRDIITKLDNFRTKFFTYSSASDTNLLSNAFYNSMTSVSSSSAVKVISSTSQAAANIKIDSIQRLATAYKISTADDVQISKQLEGTEITEDTLAAMKDQEMSIDVSLDGVKKTIRFKGTVVDPANPPRTNLEVGDLVKNLNDSLSKAFGSTVKAEKTADGKGIKFAGGGLDPDSHTIILTETKDGETLKQLGFSDGASNKLNYNSLLTETPFATALQGNEFEFSINGTVIKASGSDTVGDVINRINNSEAGVRVTYNAITDKFTMESKTTGNIGAIELIQTKGNILTAMFGTAPGNQISGSMKNLPVPLAAPDSMDTGLLDSIAAVANQGGQSFRLHINGQGVEVSIPEQTDPYDKDSLIQAVNTQLAAAFGNDKIKLSEGTSGKMQITASGGYQVSFDEADSQHNLNRALGFTAQADSPKVKESTILGDLGLGGTLTVNQYDSAHTIVAAKTVHLDRTKSIEDNITAMNQEMNGIGTVSFDADSKSFVFQLSNDQVEITGADADGTKTLQTLFGQESLSYNPSGSTFLDGVPGQNAVLTVDGVEIERNSNQFELNGVNIQLTAESTGPISLTTERNTDKIVEGIKDFVDDYNQIVDELNGYLTEKSNYRSYAPLTDAQKKEMTEKEIDRWEEKAKQGLLRNDSTIESLLNDMRTVMYQTVDSAGLALYDVGLETSSNYKDNGKLTLDEDKLRAALSTNLDKVQQLFSNKTDGVAQALGDILKDAANVSSGSPGTLVSYAGAKTALDTQNTLSKELVEIGDRIKELNTRYEAERARYWQQFSSMEQAMAQLNSQSSWVSQQFSGSN